MTVLNELAAIEVAVKALQAVPPTPTTNFATPDVVAQLDAIATSLGTPTSTAPDPAPTS